MPQRTCIENSGHSDFCGDQLLLFLGATKRDVLCFGIGSPASESDRKVAIKVCYSGGNLMHLASASIFIECVLPENSSPKHFLFENTPWPSVSESRT